MKPFVDYAVVGAGPGGALAARSLAQAGRSVALVHWGPRSEKACGGGVPPRGMRQFGELLQQTPRNHVHHIRLVGPLGEQVVMALTQPLSIFARRELDQTLRDHASSAGARIVRGRASRVEGSAGQFQLHLQQEGRQSIIAARHIVSAEGAVAGIRDQLLQQAGLPVPAGASFSKSFTTYPAGTSDTLEIAYLHETDGYAWSFPRGDHASVGVCTQGRAGGSKPLQQALTRLVQHDHLTGAADLPGVGALIPSYRSQAATTSVVEGPGFCLVGDAAGSVDAITREGIHYAMFTGHEIGRVDPLNNPGAYANWYDGNIRPELLAAARWAPRFFAPRFLGTMIRALQESAALRDIFQDLLAGEQSYQQLRRRLCRTLPRSAWTLWASWRASGRSQRQLNGTPPSFVA